MTDITVRVIDCHIAVQTDTSFRFLILKRSNETVCPNHWQCVTGKIEQGELPYIAAIREVKEETGLRPVRMWTVDTVNFFYEHKVNQLNVVPVFGMIVDNFDVSLSNEHVDFKWLSIDQALDSLIWRKQIDGLREFNRMLITETEKNSFLEIDIDINI